MEHRRHPPGVPRRLTSHEFQSTGERLAEEYSRDWIFETNAPYLIRTVCGGGGSRAPAPNIVFYRNDRIVPDGTGSYAMPDGLAVDGHLDAGRPDYFGDSAREPKSSASRPLVNQEPRPQPGGRIHVQDSSRPAGDAVAQD